MDTINWIFYKVLSQIYTMETRGKKKKKKKGLAEIAHVIRHCVPCIDGANWTDKTSPILPSDQVLTIPLYKCLWPSCMNRRA